jgi:hypothetical protein
MEEQPTATSTTERDTTLAVPVCEWLHASGSEPADFPPPLQPAPSFVWQAAKQTAKLAGRRHLAGAYQTVSNGSVACLVHVCARMLLL